MKERREYWVEYFKNGEWNYYDIFSTRESARGIKQFIKKTGLTDRVRIIKKVYREIYSEVIR